MECKKDRNIANCNCSYGGCPRHGICCDCVMYHLKSRQVPACFFPEEVERTYDRSFEKFAELVASNQV